MLASGFMARRLGVFIASAALLMGGCASPRSDSAEPGIAADIAAIETELRAPVAVKGEPIESFALSDRMKRYNVPGVSIAVIRDGRIVWAKGFGVLQVGEAKAVNAETLFQAASISKPVATAGALRMVERGQLSLDAPLNDALVSWKVPDNAFTSKRAPTLRQVMSHAAGFTVHGFGGYASGVPVPTAVQVVQGGPPANSAPVRIDKLPGESFRYSGGGMTVMQILMGDVSHREFAPLLHDLVLAPAGMTHSTYEQPLPAARLANAAAGHGTKGEAIAGLRHTYPELAAAGLWTTPEDLSRLSLKLVAAARHEPGAILGPGVIDQMMTVQMAPYGLGVSLDTLADGKTFGHGGSNAGFQSRWFAYADGHGGAAVMTNGDGGQALASEILAGLAAHYGWAYGAQEVREAVQLSPQQAASLVGAYASIADPTSRLTITNDASGLRLDGAPYILPARLYAASDTELFMSGGERFQVKRDAAGQVTALTIGSTIFARRAA